MFTQGQGMDANALAMMSAGGQLGAQQSAANNAAMNNYMGGYEQAAGYQARRGQAIAGGFQGLGGSLGNFSDLGGGGGANAYNPSSYDPYANESQYFRT